MTQYYSRSDTAYSGSAIFSIPFSYIDKDDISVYIIRDEVELEADFTWLNDSQITVTDDLETDDVISIRRNTPIDEKIVTYQNMSMVLDKDNLNLSQDQLLNVVQEMYDNNVTFEIKVEGDITDIAEDVVNANETANEAKSIANDAKTKAENAVSTANIAETKANNAVSTANSASNTANTASSNATNAVNTANTAKNTADSAKNKVDTLETDIASVIAAAEKINQLEEAVNTAINAASTASNKAQQASNKATEAVNAANRAEAVIPSQAGQNGKFLKTNGTSTSWENVDALPSQTGKNGKFLKTDGTDASWEDIPDALPSQTGHAGEFLTTDGTDASWGVVKTHNLFDFKWSDYLLNDQSWLRADTFSWQSGTTYSDAYNHLVADLQDATFEHDSISWTQPILTANGTIGGNSFAVSASSEYSASYQAYKAFDGSTSTEWVTLGNSSPAYIEFYNPKALNVTLLTLTTRSESTETFTAGTIYGSNDNSTWDILKTYTNSATSASSTWTIDLSDNTAYYKYYKIEGTTFSGTNNGFSNIVITARELLTTCYRATDGHKICLADQETVVANIYSETGIAWYYILDTSNTRFKFPRTKFGFEGLRSNVGDLIKAGLPNITGSFHVIGNQTWSQVDRYKGAFYDARGASEVNSYTNATNNSSTYAAQLTTLDASRSSSIYGNSSTVQEQAVQMYLYFYVGEFSQTATEQTAGLNSELFNGKADVDLSNISASQSAKNEIVGWGMPDYTSAISVPGTCNSLANAFIAPSDGILYFYTWVSNTSGVYINNTYMASIYSGGSQGYGTTLPLTVTLNKGDSFFTPLISTMNGVTPSGTFLPMKGAN